MVLASRGGKHGLTQYVHPFTSDWTIIAPDQHVDEPCIMDGGRLSCSSNSFHCLFELSRPSPQSKGSFTEVNTGVSAGLTDRSRLTSIHALLEATTMAVVS